MKRTNLLMLELNKGPTGMNKLLFFILLITMFFLFGCSKSNHRDELVDQSDPVPSKSSFEEADSLYNSITEYSNTINGSNIKTGGLIITKKNNYIYLNMDFILSSKLEKALKSTKGNFYFTFSGIDGQDKINDKIAERPKYIEGNLDKLKSNDHYHLFQKMKIKDSSTLEEIKTILSPENYQLIISNERKEAVAIIIGLDLNMIYSK
ncbi:hypothetical protein [Rummeliibacillus suwonensis]|uniref:hypothetical protein n=1 Tax=Rummeliibacillus suwonensis TaxID=1306154 RepID=UPI001AAEA51C|nr:hypothetical protein [Rummeliibacillus suwonensis]MBO2537752.1 hypothetical protein [Rummeliibacillus suwonensis]